MLSLFFALRTAVVFGADPGCTPTCTSGGTTYYFDYHHLMKLPGGSLYTGSDGEYKFTMNVCGEAWGSASDSCTGVLCQYSLPDENFVANVASWAETQNGLGLWQPIDPEDCTKGMQLALANIHDCYVGGISNLPRVATIKYICDAEGLEVPITFDVTEFGTCQYEVQMRSQSHCDTSFVCANAPCKNNGECELDRSIVGGIRCHCLSEWTGPTCEERNPCFPGPCMNGGTCSILGDGDYLCQCHSAYIGTHCDARLGSDACSTLTTSKWRGWGVFSLSAFLVGGMAIGVKYYRKQNDNLVYNTQFADNYDAGNI
eukprot:gb/GEZN01010786.1/.p1 GENE.gb/GEZN01010786.1/~~gb/GEZN01010786.1/.p1  ORF type:complete len:315 (-),score=21.08 gb/GEZN01010786.1/:244-1188(-)